MTKNGSAVTEIENSGERGDGAAEREREVALAREEDEAVAGPDRRVAAVPARTPPGAQRERRDADDRERERVEREREPQQPGGAERAADAAGRR